MTDTPEDWKMYVFLKSGVFFGTMEMEDKGCIRQLYRR